MTSLYDWMASHGYMDSGCDCYDNVFSYPALCIIPNSEPEDAYDRAINWILKETEFMAAGSEPAYDLTGNFAKLVKDNLKGFVEFSQRNKDAYVMDPEEGISEDNVYKGCCTIHSLCAGHYSEESYEDFLRIMGAKA